MLIRLPQLKSPLVLGLVLAIVVRIALFEPGISSGDSKRYLEQATSLLEGRGLEYAGTPGTSVPPGYPVFVAMVHCLLPSLDALLRVQVLLSVASCYLVYLALLPRSRNAAYFGLFGLAATPWVAQYSSYVLSETLGVFVASILAFLASKYETGTASWPVMFLIGLTCCALILTSPATLILGTAVCACVAVKQWRKPCRLLALAVGIAALMLPWQVYCYRVLGRCVPTVLSVNPKSTMHGVLLWNRTWTTGEDDARIAWEGLFWCRERPDAGSLPDRAFRSSEERKAITDAVDAWADRRATREEVGGMLERIAIDRRDSEPFRFYVVLPIMRAWSMWTDMPRVSHFSQEAVGRLWVGNEVRCFGMKRGLLRFAKAVLSLAAIVVYDTYAFVFAVAILGTLVNRKGIAIAITIGVLAFTASSAGLAITEARRNWPFYPMLLFLMFYFPADSFKQHWVRLSCKLRQAGKRAQCVGNL